MKRYKIADVVFDAEINYEYTKNLCQAYEYEGEEKPVFHAVVSKEDIAAEKVLVKNFPDDYAESLALFRKLCEYALSEADGIIFHSSAIMVDGEAYLFIAPSGTGKSTHTRLWREMLGERAVMINDDKPIVRFVDGDFYAYGTPWNGKHHLGTNCRAKIKAICSIYQSPQNTIRKANFPEMIVKVLNQTLRPREQEKMDKLLSLIDKMLTSVELYSLGCDVSREAAELSYKTMSQGEAFMKIKDGFILRKVADSYIVVAVGERVKDFNGVINLNETGAFLWKLLEKGNDHEGLKNALLEEYNVQEAVAEKDVKAFMNKLMEAGLVK